MKLKLINVFVVFVIALSFSLVPVHPLSAKQIRLLNDKCHAGTYDLRPVPKAKDGACPHWNDIKDQCTLPYKEYKKYMLAREKVQKKYQAEIEVYYKKSFEYEAEYQNYQKALANFDEKSEKYFKKAIDFVEKNPGKRLPRALKRPKMPKEPQVPTIPIPSLAYVPLPKLIQNMEPLDFIEKKLLKDYPQCRRVNHSNDMPNQEIIVKPAKQQPTQQDSQIMVPALRNALRELRKKQIAHDQKIITDYGIVAKQVHTLNNAFLNSNLQTKFRKTLKDEMINLMHQALRLRKQFIGDWRLNEGWGPTILHISPCHYLACAADIALIDTEQDFPDVYFEFPIPSIIQGPLPIMERIELPALPSKNVIIRNSPDRIKAMWDLIRSLTITENDTDNNLKQTYFTLALNEYFNLKGCTSKKHNLHFHVEADYKAI